MGKLNGRKQQLLVCGFLACLQLLMFAVIGLNTINIKY